MHPVAAIDLPSLQLRVRVPERVLMRRVGDEMVMLDLGREHYYGLNDVGARLMQIAEDGATLAQVSALLAEEFDATREQVEGDVRRLASELIAAGLIEATPDA